MFERDDQVSSSKFTKTPICWLEKLYSSIHEVLRIGIINRGTSLGKGKSNYKDLNGKSGRPKDMVKAYGRGGKNCERCSNKMEKIYVAQRGTTICPICQSF